MTPSEITLTVGFVKADGSTYACVGNGTNVLVRYGDFKGVPSDEFDLVIDTMVEDGSVVRVG